MQKRQKFFGVLLSLLMMTAACANKQHTDQGSDQQETETSSGHRETETVELTISAAASLKDAMDAIQQSYK